MANVATLSCIFFALVFFSVNMGREMVEANDRQPTFPIMNSDDPAIKRSVDGNCSFTFLAIKLCDTPEGRERCHNMCLVLYKPYNPRWVCQDFSPEYPKGKCFCYHSIC
ncbi:hypothetical protein ABFS82_01G075800 [Erythranthe guttata]